MNGTWAKLTVSTLLLGTAAIGCTTTAGVHPAMLGSSGPKATRLAATAAAEASSALAAHHAAVAVRPAETAVAAAPQDAAYRALLGQAYLQAGRFASAETALGEALTLDPANARAGLNLALAQAALGRRDRALATLQTIRDHIAPADLGLAMALCGDHDAAAQLLLGAARQPDAGVRVRQNLAFALALGGHWAEARAVAAQDVSPAELDQRMGEWAMLARPRRSSDQIAAVLGVTPMRDPGEPTMLALAQPVPVPTPMAVPERTAAAAPAPVAAPAEVAPVTAVPAPAPQVAQAAPEQASAPVDSFVTPAAATVAAAPMIAAASRTSSRVAPSPSRDGGLLAAAAPSPKQGSGAFVVQLGAFVRPQAPQAAWEAARGRFIQLASFAPSSGTFSAAGRAAPLYRLSIAGFATRPDAVNVCMRIRARHTDCFVRHEQNDQLADWGKPGKGLALASR